MSVRPALGLLAVCLLAWPARPALALDAEAAEALARKNNCFKCHALERHKEATPWRDVAKKYRGKPDAESKLIYHVTSGEMVRFEDGHEEEHKVLKAKEADVKNLVAWILSL